MAREECQSWINISAPAGCSLTENIINLPSRAFGLLPDPTDTALYNLHQCSASAVAFQQVISSFEQFFSQWFVYNQYFHPEGVILSASQNCKNKYEYIFWVPSHSNETAVSQAMP